MKQNIGYLVVLVLGSCTLVWLFVSYLPMETFLSMEVLLVIVGGLSSAAGFLYIQLRKEKNKQRDRLLTDEKAYLCEMLDLFFTIMREIKSGKDGLDNKFVKRFLSIQPAFLAWASPDFICAWNDFQEGLVKNQGNVTGIIRIQERFFRAIRKECGHNDDNLRPGELMAFLMVAEERDSVLRACRKEKYE